MSPLTRAIRDELLELVRTDRELREELRRILAIGDDALVTIAGAAQVASVSPPTVSRWIRSGELTATGRGKATRIRRADLVAFLERGGRRRVDVELDPERLAELEDGPAAGDRVARPPSHAARAAATGRRGSTSVRHGGRP